MAIITVQDLAVYLGRSIPAGEHANAATEIIEGLEGDLEAFVKRPISETVVADEVVTVRHGMIFLRQTPVRSVASFTVDGTVQDVDWYEVETWGLRPVASIGFPSPLVSPSPVLLVSYTAGLPGEDPTSAFGRKARATLLRAAARDYNQVVREDLAGVARAGFEGTNLEFHGGVAAGAGGLTERELSQFVRWKRRLARR